MSEGINQDKGREIVKRIKASKFKVQAAIQEDTVRVNGKKRDELLVPKDADRAEIERLALASERVQKHLGGATPKKVIAVPGRLVNLVV